MENVPQLGCLGHLLLGTLPEVSFFEFFLTNSLLCQTLTVFLFLLSAESLGQIKINFDRIFAVGDRFICAVSKNCLSTAGSRYDMIENLRHSKSRFCNS